METQPQILKATPKIRGTEEVTMENMDNLKEKGIDTIFYKITQRHLSKNHQQISSKRTDEIHENNKLPIINVTEITSPKQSKSYKLILGWSTLYGKMEHWKWWFDNEKMKQVCPNYSCHFSTERNDLNISDAVIFHIYSENINLNDFPAYHNPKQHWVFFTIEPPEPHLKNTYQKLNGYFNWTMTYRFDADIPLYYGENFKILNSKNNTDEERTKNYAKGKNQLVVWFASHCPTEGHREKYVKELQNFVDVDIYGQCGDKLCSPPRSPKCYNDILDKYKFYLAFENILCRDYVTEKLFNILSYPIVPIVFGSANYSYLAPSKSFIDSLSFQSPKHLAEYLLQLDKNDTLYNKYFDWKRGKTIISEEFSSRTLGCDLCKKLSEENVNFRTYSNIYKWWYEESECQKWNNNTLYNL